MRSDGRSDPEGRRKSQASSGKRQVVSRNVRNAPAFLPNSRSLRQSYGSPKRSFGNSSRQSPVRRCLLCVRDAEIYLDQVSRQLFGGG